LYIFLYLGVVEEVALVRGMEPPPPAAVAAEAVLNVV
jgi:hypothetical protein